MTTAPMEQEATGANRLSDLARSIFSTVGILPILLAVVIFYFASQESRFYGIANLTNVLRQSTYLIIVTLGQALVLISGGFDLSVGAVIAVTSVVSARYMSAISPQILTVNCPRCLLESELVSWSAWSSDLSTASVSRASRYPRSS